MIDLLSDLETTFKGRQDLFNTNKWPVDKKDTILYYKLKKDNLLVHYKKGTIYAISDLDITDPDIAELRTVVVNQNIRGKGYGKKTMKELAAYILHNGRMKLELMATEEAFGFYKKLNMKNVKGTNEYIGNIEWLLKMSKGVKY